MLDKIIERLRQLGHVVSEDEKASLTFLINKANKFILDECNITEVPENVRPAEIDYICYEYLHTLDKASQIADNLGSKEVTSITEGDTSVSYGDGSKGTLATMLENSRAWLLLAMEPHRCMRW